MGTSKVVLGPVRTFVNTTQITGLTVLRISSPEHKTGETVRVVTVTAVVSTSVFQVSTVDGETKIGGRERGSREGPRLSWDVRRGHRLISK